MSSAGSEPLLMYLAGPDVKGTTNWFRSNMSLRQQVSVLYPIAYLCKALAELAARPDLELSYPMHLNPKVQGSVLPVLSGIDKPGGSVT